MPNVSHPAGGFKLLYCSAVNVIFTAPFALRASERSGYGPFAPNAATGTPPASASRAGGGGPRQAGPSHRGEAVLVRKDIDVFPAGEIEFGARGEEVETGLCQRRAVLARQH